MLLAKREFKDIEREYFIFFPVYRASEKERGSVNLQKVIQYP